MAKKPRTASGGLFLAWLDALPTDKDVLLNAQDLAAKQERADRIEAAMRQHIERNAAEAAGQ
jgi:hypothetical protein